MKWVGGDLPNTPQLKCFSSIRTSDNKRVEELYDIVSSFIREAEVYANNRGIKCEISYNLFTFDPVNDPLNERYEKYFDDFSKKFKTSN